MTMRIRKWDKKTILIPIVILLILLGSGIFVRLTYEIRFYAYRPKECIPEELIVILERAFGVNFPPAEEITEIKTAKSIPSSDSGDIQFVVKFTAGPNVVDAFVRSFPKEISLEEYKSSGDKKTKIRYPPTWYTKPIQRGKATETELGPPGYGLPHIIKIDMTRQDFFILYWTGWYDPGVHLKKR